MCVCVCVCPICLSMYLGDVSIILCHDNYDNGYFTVQGSITSIDRQSSINEELGRYNERINYQHSSTLQLHEDEEEDKSIVIDRSMISSARVPLSHSSKVHSSNHQDQRPDQGGTVVDKVTASTSNESTRKLEREPSVTTKEASSPAFLFITWNGVYEYMRSEGIKVSYNHV